MPLKRITRIEFPVKLPAPAQPQPRKRVAAYARVSTMKDAQENSLQSQQDYFAEYIRHHPDWVFVGIYTDMYNRILIQCPPHRSVEKWLKQRLSADLNYLPKAFFFVS